MHDSNWPRSSTSARLKWASDNHIFQGMCPDDVEGWEVRDPSCLACYWSDMQLFRLGLGPAPVDVAIPWDEISEREFKHNMEMIFALAFEREGVERLFALLEEVAFSSSYKQSGITKLREVEFLVQDFPEFDEKLEHLRSAFLLNA